MRRSLIRAALLLIALGSPIAHLHGETLVDSQLAFSLELPSGFVPRPDLVGKTPDLVHAYQLGTKAEGEIPVLLFIEKLGGVIGRERLDKAKMPPGFKGELFVAKWQGFDVDGITVFEDLNGVRAVTYNVQIPLRREAIQIKLFGRADREETLQPLLREVLAGLKGDSNWLPSAAPPSVANRQDYGFILLGAAIVGLLIGGVALWFVARSSAILAIVIAVALFFGSALPGDTRIREMKMLVGSLRMLGTFGIILGFVFLILQLVSKRRAKPSLAPIAATRRDKP